MALPSPFLFSPKIFSMQYPRLMKTKRLTLRTLGPGDAARIAVLAGVWEVASMTGRIPFPYSEAAAFQWIDELAEGEVVYGIEHQGDLIGVCGFKPIGGGVAELGYWIGKSYWGRGFATEAAAALMAHGFTHAGVKQFVCKHLAGNVSSRRVIEKLGFKYTGPATSWCEARQMDMPSETYERRRPWVAALRALAS